MSKRIIGFDFARALAIFGMVVVNYKIAMQAVSGNQGLLWFSSLVEGRASALFVILAGIGVTILSNSARKTKDPSSAANVRTSLLKRGLLLVAIGIAYTPIWEADILHFYGFYFLFAAALFMSSNRGLLAGAAAIVFLFPLLMLLLDYEKGWNWSTLTYESLWTFDGMVRHIVFNGFHPVIPWSGFLLFGMWLGRLELTQESVRRKLLAWSLATWMVVEATFALIRFVLIQAKDLRFGSEEVDFLFSVSIIPPLPQYMVSATATAVMVIVVSMYCSDKWGRSKIYQSICQTGRLSLTLYVAHVIIGMGFLESIGRLENQTIEFSLLSAGIFFILSIIFSVCWLKRYKSGPLESCFRRIAS